MNLESGSKEKNFEKKRKHYRLNCLWDIEYQVLSDVEEEESETKQWFTGITTDISGGGCRFNSEEQQQQDNILVLKNEVLKI